MHEHILHICCRCSTYPFKNGEDNLDNLDDGSEDPDVEDGEEGEDDGIGSTTASVTTTDCATGFTAPSGSLSVDSLTS